MPDNDLVLPDPSNLTLEMMTDDPLAPYEDEFDTNYEDEFDTNYEDDFNQPWSDRSGEPSGRGKSPP